MQRERVVDEDETSMQQAAGASDPKPKGDVDLAESDDDDEPLVVLPPALNRDSG